MKLVDMPKVALGDNRYIYKRVFEDDPSEAGSQYAVSRWNEFMRTIADTPHMLQCGGHRPQRMLVHHNGRAWVAELSAEGEEAP